MEFIQNLVYPVSDKIPDCYQVEYEFALEFFLKKLEKMIRSNHNHVMKINVTLHKTLALGNTLGI